MSIIEPSDTTRRWSLSDIYNKYKDDFNKTHFVFPRKDEPTKIEKDALYVVVGTFSKTEHIAECLMLLHEKTTNILLYLPPDIDIVYMRDVLINICGESSLYMCSDGIAAKTFALKGCTMSLTLPIWNEAETIAEVIESFLPIADQIIIGVDEKTDDNSFEIASRYTSEVFYFKWEDSFCKARNACMEKSTCDWNFMTEGHEYLDPECLDVFKDLNDTEDFITMLRVKRHLCEDNRISTFPWLTRGERGCHYINDSHNAVISSTPKYNVTGDFCGAKTIHNRGAARASARNQQRFYMNRKNLLKDLIKTKDDPRALFYIGNEYDSAGEYEKAVGFWKRYLKFATWQEERYQARINCARTYLKLRDLKSAEEILLGCFAESVPRNEHMIMLADLYAEDRPDKSIYYLRMASSVEMVMSSMWVQESYYREVPLQKLCIIYGSVGRINDALKCARLVRSKYPDTPGTQDVIDKLEGAIADEDKTWDKGISDFDLVAAK